MYDDDVDGVGVGVGDAEDVEDAEDESVVGTTTTPDEEDVLVSEVDVDGWIYVIDVEIATPVCSQHWSL